MILEKTMIAIAKLYSTPIFKFVKRRWTFFTKQKWIKHLHFNFRIL